MILIAKHQTCKTIKENLWTCTFHVNAHHLLKSLQPKIMLPSKLISLMLIPTPAAWSQTKSNVIPSAVNSVLWVNLMTVFFALHKKTDWCQPIFKMFEAIFLILFGE
uniref:Uncharacterized protein n=1 Tax=Panagrolaimus sp. JU765 TaxID=591449 RepID=A0AC34QNU0_9BILA